MQLDEAKTERVRSELLENDALYIINSMRQMGISKAEALKLIDRFWEE